MPARFTYEDLRKSACAKLNQHILNEPVNKVKRAKEIPAGLKSMIEVLERHKIPYGTEYKFHETRRWRFDLVIPYLKVAAEYEGLMSKKSRHTTIKGYTGDTDKYSQAAILGWKVLRYTALNHKNFEDDLLAIVREALFLAVLLQL